MGYNTCSTGTSASAAKATANAVHQRSFDALVRQAECAISREASKGEYSAFLDDVMRQAGHRSFEVKQALEKKGYRVLYGTNYVSW